MIRVDRSNPQWLQQLMEHAVAEGWCLKMNCTTCGSDDLRQALGLLDKSSADRPRFLPMPPESAEAIVRALKACAAQSDCRMEEATRWVLYEVWRNFGDAYFSGLEGTWAGEVLARMRAHHQRRQEERRLHEARQGVKMRDWKE
jgi:hypothetical protein